MMEEWRPVVGWIGYEVSDLGNVKSLDRLVTYCTGAVHLHLGQVLQPALNPSGYLTVGLHNGERKRTITVHILVLAAFRGPMLPGQETRHLDSDPTNNKLNNLVYGTRSENNIDRVHRGTHHQVAKVMCIYNHIFIGRTLRITSDGHRMCRACNNAHSTVNRARGKGLLLDFKIIADANYLRLAGMVAR
jgi:hypothetical protein